MRSNAFSKIVMAILLIMACGTLSASPAPRRIEVVAKRFTYVPTSITLKKGVPVVLIFKSQDVAHGIEFKHLNLHADIPKKGTGQITFTPTEVGNFVGHCAHFCGMGHGEMVLTLHVTE